MRRSLRALMAVAMATAVTLMPIGAQADTTTPADYVYSGVKVTGHTLTLDSGRRPTALMQVRTADGQVIAETYCIDMLTSTRPDAPYIDVDPQDPRVPTPVTNAVHWIVDHSYPAVPVSRLAELVPSASGLTVRDAVTATQAAIWHETNGTNLTADSLSVGSVQRARVLALYHWLLENSADAPPLNTGDPSVSVTIGKDYSQGRIGPVRVERGPAGSTSTVSATVTGGVLMTTGDNPVPVDLSNVPTGTDLQVQVEGTEGEVSIEVTTTLTVRRGTVFVTIAEPHAQSLISTRTFDRSASARAVVRWRAPEPTLPHPGVATRISARVVQPGTVLTDAVTLDGIVTSVDGHAVENTLTGALHGPVAARIGKDGTPTCAGLDWSTAPVALELEPVTVTESGTLEGVGSFTVPATSTGNECYSYSERLTSRVVGTDIVTAVDHVVGQVPQTALVQLPGGDTIPGDDGADDETPGGEPGSEVPTPTAPATPKPHRPLADTGCEH